MAPKIYWLSGSPPCWNAMLTLEECGVAYDNKLLMVSKGESKTPEMLALNPRGQLPVFVDGDNVVSESLAVCLYVIGKNSNQTLLPKDDATKSLVLQRFVEATNIRSALAALYFLIRAKTPEDVDQEKKKENGDKMAAELDRWEKYLTGKDYLAGSAFTVADCSMFPHLALLVRFGLQLAGRWPNLKRYYDTISQRPTVKKTWPPEWTGDNKTVFNFIK